MYIISLPVTYKLLTIYHHYYYSHTLQHSLTELHYKINSLKPGFGQDYLQDSLLSFKCWPYCPYSVTPSRFKVEFWETRFCTNNLFDNFHLFFSVSDFERECKPQINRFSNFTDHHGQSEAHRQESRLRFSATLVGYWSAYQPRSQMAYSPKGT